MIGHQDVGMQRALSLPERCAQSMQVAVVIFVAEETRLALAAALHYVQRNTVKVDARAAGHDRILASAQK